jgi:membrane protein implicated in regulation of membrane protease activity
MMDLLKLVVFWHWWILAGVLLILELTTPTYFFLWLAIAASAVGFLVLAFPGMGIEVQLLTFGGLSIVAAIAWHRFREQPQTETEQGAPEKKPPAVK